jgi:PAS domain S-box-containing protein
VLEDVLGGPGPEPAPPGATAGSQPLAGPMDGVFRLDSDWRFTFLNHAAVIYLGGGEMLGRTLWEVVPGLIGTACEAEYRAAMAERRPHDIVGPAAAHPGRWVEARLFPVGEELEVHLRDVTERVEVEQQLRRSEERLRLAQDAGGICHWDWELATDRVHWSEGYYRLWQIDPEVTPSFESFLAAVDPRDRDAVCASLEEARQSGEPWSMQMRVAGTEPVRWIAGRGEYRHDGEGRVVRMIGVCWDVTEMVTAGERLRHSEARYRRLFEQANDLIYMCDLEQRITECNPAVARALCLKVDELVGRHLSEFLTEEGAAQATEMIRRKLAQGGTTFHEIAVRRSDGFWRTWEINSGLVLDERGEPLGVHAVARDVTDRKAAEEQQRLLLDELNHRVKNTLAIVQSIAQQTLRNGGAEPSLQKMFEGRLMALATAHDLLTRENWSSASLRTIVEDAIRPFCDENSCLATGPDLRVSPKTAVNFALALHELATNASKYGALSVSGGRVHVDWKVAGERFIFEWRESGGPPVAEPQRRGFGTRLLERALSRELQGTASLVFRPDGLLFQIDAPRYNLD